MTAITRLRHRRSNHMTREEVEQALQWLSAKFGIRGGVELVWKDRMRNGRSDRVATIVMGPMAFCGVRDMMLHEFAHIIAEKRGAYRHDDKYAACLMEVVKTWMNPRKFWWATEFPAVRELAAREGLLEKSVLRKARSKCLQKEE